MNENEIKQAIEKKVKNAKKVDYSIWYIGITEDPDRRKREHEDEGKNTKFWIQWKADTETIARNVEEYFIDKGMKGGTGGGENPTYVYVF